MTPAVLQVMTYRSCKAPNVVSMACVLLKSFIAEHRTICCICGNARIESTTGDAYVFESARAMWEIFTVPLAEAGASLPSSEIFVASCTHMSTAVAHTLSAFRMSPVAAPTFREHNSNAESSKALNGSAARRCFSNTLSCLASYAENVTSAGSHPRARNLGSTRSVRLIALETPAKTHRDPLSAGKANSSYKTS